MDVLKSLLCSALELELFLKKRHFGNGVNLFILSNFSLLHLFLIFFLTFIYRLSSFQFSLSLSLFPILPLLSFINLPFIRFSFLVSHFHSLPFSSSISLSPYLFPLYSILSPSRLHLSRFHLLPFSLSSSLFTSLSHLLTSPLYLPFIRFSLFISHSLFLSIPFSS